MALGIIIGAGGGGGGTAKIRNIQITTPPTKTSYTAGETLDLTGIVVKANWSSGLSVDITAECTFAPAAGAVIYEDTTEITVSYVNGGTTYTTTQAITVQRVLTGLRVDTEPTTSYVAGQALDLSGAVVSAVFSSGRSVVVSATPSIADGTIIYEDTTSLTWSYTENGVTQTAVTALTVQRVLQSIAVTTQPTTTTYKSGDTIDATGMVVTATYHRTTATVTGYTVTPTTAGATEGTQTETVTYTENGVTKTAVFYVTIKNLSIYGVEWDGTSTTAWTRTDAAAGFTDPVPAVNNGNGSSPFDSCAPWSGIVKENRTGGVMVKIPKFWYKLTQSGNSIKVQIADAATDGFSVSPAHMNRGDGKGERDYIYVGRYHCAASDYKSSTGEKPKASVTRSAARTAIHNLGTNIWQMDFATRFTIWLLYIVEFADWHSQAKIGYGCGNNSATENMGYTDSMTYHTGTTQSSRTTYGLGTQYRWIEGLWDNVYDWCDGCYYNSSGLNIIMNPSSFSDSSGGTVAGLPVGGWPKKFTVSSAGGFPLFYPTEAGGSESTYSCDGWYFSASDPCLCVGGNCSRRGGRGLFCVSYGGASDSSAVIGCRLLELP